MMRSNARKSYGWCRLYNDFPTHPKWRVVAAMAAVPVHQVVAIVTTLLVRANKATPRGSIADFSVLEGAAALDLPADNVARVYAALEEIGWVDQEYLVTWDERQPDKEDATNAERQRRFKERKRAERSNAVTSVTVTPRLDKIRKIEPVVENLGAARAEAKRLSNKEDGGSEENRAQADLWLSSQGVKIVATRCSIIADVARNKMVGWRTRSGRDPVLLARILAEVDDQGLVGDRFQRTVEGNIDRLMRETKFGLPLPFGPKSVNGGRE